MSNNNGHKEARETIQSFINRYAPLYPNGDHTELIQLAAFPVAVTVHLLYQIWANFGTFIRNGVACKIDALAVNDCIQSNLFRQTGPDLFEMDANVRQCLLEDLRANRGGQFVKEELAAFLYQYSRQNTQGSAWRNYYDAQQWTAIMEVDEKAAAEQILSSLAQELQKKNTSRGLGIVNLIAALEKDNKQFSGLLRKALNKPDTAQAEPGTVTSKRIVLTDEIVEGKTPVRINLPPSLSNRLKKVVRVNPLAADEKRVNEQGTVYGFFAAFAKDGHKRIPRRISDLFIQMQYIQKENITILSRPQSELLDVRDDIDMLLSKSKTEDIVIIYFNCAPYRYTSMIGKITPQVLNDLIIKHFPRNAPDVIFILEAEAISSDWFDLESPAFTLLTTGGTANKKGKTASVSKNSEKGLFEYILGRSNRDITYEQLYINLVQEFIQTNVNASIFNLPHFISGKLDWNQQLFSPLRRESEQDFKNLFRRLGYAPEINRISELYDVFIKNTSIMRREKAISYTQVLLAREQRKKVTSLWLLQERYGLDLLGTKNISSQIRVWTSFFGNREDDKDQDVIRMFKYLLDINILFIGLSPKLLSGLNLIRLRTVMNICRAKKVLMYFIIEEACQWQQLDVQEEDVLLDGITLLDYLNENGLHPLLKTAYGDIEEMFKQKASKEYNTSGKTYGIFVGINNYADKQFNLHESANDARKMRVALEYAQLLEAENVRMIIDQEATRAKVVNVLQKSFSTAKSEDTILFYFSGHSSNQQTDSALFFHDLDRTSEYTSQAQNGILTDFEFKEMVKAAPNDPTVILILDTHGGSRQWLDENNPKHFSIMATHLEEMCYELAGIGGMLTEALTQCISAQPHISYIDLYQSVMTRFLDFAHDKSFWQTPLFIVPKVRWNDHFLSNTAASPNDTDRKPKTYEYLQTRNTLECLYYSHTEPGAFTFYNQVKFALFEKRVNFEHLDSWAAIDKSFSVHNRFPEMIFIALKESMYAPEPKYNIEKLLAIADVMQIPVYFILEDKSTHDPSVYKSYPLLPADETPVVSGEDVMKLIHELEGITAPLVEFLKPVEEDYETWGISIGITHYENLPGLPAGASNARRFSDWLSGRLKNRGLQETLVTNSDVTVRRRDLNDTFYRLALSTPSPGKKRVFYIYICGYALRHETDFLLCLAPWSEGDVDAVANINNYIKMLSRSDVAKVIVFAEFVPLDIAVKESYIFPMGPAPTGLVASCFFKVQLNLHDNTYSEKSGIVMDGLEGEAVLDNNTITLSSLTAYLNERSKREGIAQYPEIIIKDTKEDDFVIARLDPLITSSGNNTHHFKQKWVLIAGTGKASLSQPEWLMSNAIAKELARSGYGVITGGWPGVDAVAAEAYAGQLEEDKIVDAGYLVQVVLEDQVPAYPGGLIERVANETQSYEETLEKAYVVIMIGGVGGTYVSYRRAEEAGIPVFPIASTGGDAAKAHTEIKERRLLPAYFLSELARPIKNFEDATRTADAIRNFLDEGLNKPYYSPDPA